MEIQNKLHVKWSEKHHLSPRCREPGRPPGSCGWIHSPGAVELPRDTCKCHPFGLITIQLQFRPARICGRNGPSSTDQEPTLLPARGGGGERIIEAQGSVFMHSSVFINWSFPGARHSRPHTPPRLSQAAPRGLLGQPRASPASPSWSEEEAPLLPFS